jgi:hypothetical protein
MRCSRICIITSVISSRSIKRGSGIEASSRVKGCSSISTSSINGRPRCG